MVYLVVGSSSGIGAEVARKLAAKGSSLIATGRDPTRLTAIGLEIAATIWELEAQQ